MLDSIILTYDQLECNIRITRAIILGQPVLFLQILIVHLVQVYITNTHEKPLDPPMTTYYNHQRY